MLVSPIKPREMTRRGGNDTIHSVSRAVASAARSAESTAQVFGIASASTKKKMTFRKKPMMTPVRRTAGRRAVT